MKDFIQTKMSNINQLAGNHKVQARSRMFWLIRTQRSRSKWCIRKQDFTCSLQRSSQGRSSKCPAWNVQLPTSKCSKCTTRSLTVTNWCLFGMRSHNMQHPYNLLGWAVTLDHSYSSVLTCMLTYWQPLAAHSNTESVLHSINHHVLSRTSQHHGKKRKRIQTELQSPNRLPQRS